jgi:hypothetical protein
MDVPKGDIPSLGLTDGDIGLLRGVDYDHLQRILELSVLGPEQFQDE